MGRRDGHIELERALDTIQVGHRHRSDLGDLTELCGSIERLGLLQPVTISPNGTLLCGARRLAAIKQLGWRTVKVFVRSGISSTIDLLLAEQHENTMRAELVPTEAAALYDELKTLIAEDAARRQQGTRFGAEKDKPARDDGGVQWNPPSDGKTREQAAQLVTGRKSQNRLERINELTTLADRDDVPDTTRTRAREALQAIDDDGNVYGHYATVKAAHAVDQLNTMANDPDRPASMRKQAADEAVRLHEHADTAPAELLRESKAALDRAKGADPRHDARAERRRSRRRGVTAFTVLWNELSGWTDRFDPTEIGPKLSDDQWETFETTVAATLTFAEHARHARLDPQVATTPGPGSGDPVRT